MPAEQTVSLVSQPLVANLQAQITALQLRVNNSS